MSAGATRMLLLGGVAMFEPVNGYQIRRELMSWHVEEWAHILPGSIYHGLRTLTDQELLRRHDLVDGTRTVAVYETTPAGRDELVRLQVLALKTVDTHDRIPFQVAFGMLPNLDRATVLAALRARRVSLESRMTDFVRGADDPANGPPHARRSWVLWLDLASAELAWLREVIADIESGELRFAPGEDWGWTPPADDPGWQMETDRERYRQLLGR